MKERTKLGLGVLEAALLVGILGDALLRATPWGLNVLLWTAALVLAAAALARRRRTLHRPDAQWLLPGVLLFAAAFAWRDSPVLKSWDAIIILVLLGLAATRERGVRLRLAGLRDYILGVALAGFQAFFGMFPLLFQDIAWKELPRTGWTRHLLAVARGLLLAVPLVFIFGALLAAADAIFDNLVRRTLSIEPDRIISHLFLTGLFAWLAGGFLRAMLFGAHGGRVNRRRAALETLRHAVFGTLGLTAGLERQAGQAAPGAGRQDPQAAATGSAAATGAATAATYGQAASDEQAATAGEPEGASASPNEQRAGQDVETAGESTTAMWAKRAREVFSLGLIETSVVLGLVNLLFVAFVVVQLRYFFGGAEWVVSSTGLTYAEYARRGFFELVWVAALVLPMLLGMHALLRKSDPLCERVFRLLAGLQVVLLFVIMASAMKRMRLYQSEYGMTELRLYTTAFMGWLGLVFVWFAATVLRGRRERFVYGALLAGLTVIASLHLLNPDRFIVTNNATLAHRGHPFDARYASQLSADAVPALLRAMPALGAEEQGYIASRLLDRWSSDKGEDWRTWNWSRTEAHRAVSAHRATLDSLAEIYRRESETKRATTGTAPPASGEAQTTPATSPAPQTDATTRTPLLTPAQTTSPPASQVPTASQVPATQRPVRSVR